MYTDPKQLCKLNYFGLHIVYHHFRQPLFYSQINVTVLVKTDTVRTCMHIEKLNFKIISEIMHAARKY